MLQDGEKFAEKLGRLRPQTPTVVYNTDVGNSAKIGKRTRNMGDKATTEQHVKEKNGVVEKEDTFDRDGQDEPDAHPQGLQMVLLTMSLMFAVFIMALDTTILCMLGQLSTYLPGYKLWVLTDVRKQPPCRRSQPGSTASNISAGTRVPICSH